MMLKERFALAMERLCGLREEQTLSGEYDRFFKSTAAFLADVGSMYQAVESGRIKGFGREELERRNKELYKDILPMFWAGVWEACMLSCRGDKKCDSFCP